MELGSGHVLHSRGNPNTSQSAHLDYKALLVCHAAGKPLPRIRAKCGAGVVGAVGAIVVADGHGVAEEAEDGEEGGEDGVGDGGNDFGEWRLSVDDLREVGDAGCCRGRELNGVCQFSACCDLWYFGGSYNGHHNPVSRRTVRLQEMLLRGVAE